MSCLGPTYNPTVTREWYRFQGICLANNVSPDDAYNIEDAAEVAAEVSNQNKLLREKFEEMHLTLGDTFSLTLQSMNTQLESVSAYKYYKNAYNAEKKLLKAKLNEES